MAVVVVEYPPQPFVDSQDVVVKVVFAFGIVGVQLLPDFLGKCGIVDQVVDGVGYLLDVEIDIALEKLVPNRVENVVPAFSLLGEYRNQGVEIAY